MYQLKQIISSKDIDNPDFDYIVFVSSEDVDKAIVFTKKELKKHFSLSAKKKKDGDIDYQIYPHFYGRVCYDGRVRTGEERINISQYVNNYIL